MSKLYRVLVAVVLVSAVLLAAAPRPQVSYAQAVHSLTRVSPSPESAPSYVQICKQGTNPAPDGSTMQWLVCFDSNNYGFEFWTNPYYFSIYFFGDSPLCEMTDHFIKSGMTSEFIGIFTVDELFGTLHLGAYYCNYLP